MDQSLIFIVVLGILLLFAYLVSLNLWLTAIFSGIRITLFEMLFMRMRRSPIKDIINALIVTHKAGHPVPLVDLETQGLAGVNLVEATKAYVKCRIDGINVSFVDVAKDELAGKSWEQIVASRRDIINTEELRKSISRRVLLELSDDQVKEVEAYLSKL